ncbi:MAG: carboxypeptidase [Nanohaloarchaea archaeon SW_7_43_1]|nr:MAG: carboxypeptidase [Nanohaloarchaea archaeon SW_7_43_1]
MTSEVERLKEKSKKITNLEQTSGLLHWDQEVIMPEKGIEARSQQLSVLSGIKHEMIVSKEMHKLLESIDPEDLEELDNATYREVNREHERARKVDQELIEEISAQSSVTVDKWKEAREEDDFSVVEEQLQELIKLKREYVEQIDTNEEPYKVLFNDYEPYIRFETMEEIMETLKSELKDILEKIRESSTDPDNIFEREIEEERQMEINREILNGLGYDWSKGRIDISEHPFTIGNQFDARITTRVDEKDVSKTLMPTIHEFGHALYEQNLPENEYGFPVGESRDLSIHESQSRLWENHVGRSESFWKYIQENITEFEESDAKELYRSINRVKEDNLIRVEADELSYHLHIYLRFKLERQLVNGDIEVTDLPEKWNEKMENLLGIRPENDKTGVLQDIHWYQGSIGYFTTYSLGSVISAQLYETIEKDVKDLDEKVESGEFGEVREWLKENIHQHGKHYRTEKLVEKASGEKPGADSFLDYIRDKYSEIYDLNLET